MDDLAVVVDGGHPLYIAAIGDLVALRIETIAGAAAGKQLLDMAGANMTVDLPAEILDRTAQNEMKLLKERLSRSGITLEQHCKNSRTTPEALEKDYRAQAESRIRFVLAARAIAEAENIVVHPEEVNAEYRRLSQLQDTPEAEIRKALPEDTIAAALAAGCWRDMTRVSLTDPDRTRAMVEEDSLNVEALLRRRYMVVTYRLNPISALVARCVIKTKYYAMANILAGCEMFPELLQEKATSANLTDAALAWLEDRSGLRRRTGEVMERARATLGEEGVYDFWCSRITGEAA